MENLTQVLLNKLIKPYLINLVLKLCSKMQKENGKFILLGTSC